MVFIGLLFIAKSTVALPGNQIRVDTLAVIGNRAITSDRFIRLYKEKLVRFGLSDNGTTRMGYLKNLVDDEILIYEAKAKHVDRTEAARAEIDRIHTQELINAYYDKHISTSISVSDAELKDLFSKMNTKLNVRHLYAHSKEGADSLHRQLLSGQSFEELARKVFQDPRLRETGGCLGYISVDEMDPAFELAAFHLKVGEISKPVRTVKGYSIIRVDDIKGNPFITESEFLKVKDRLKGFARKRKSEETTRQFTTSLRSRLNIQFNEPLVNKLYGVMHTNPSSFSIEDTAHSFSTIGQKTMVVTSTSERWNVKHLVQALSKTNKSLLKWIHSEEDLKDFVAGLLIQKHLSSLAQKEKLDSTPAFKQNVKEAFDSYLLTALEADMKEQIHISEDSLKQFYAHHKNKFVVSPEIRLSAILLDDKNRADTVRLLLEAGKEFSSLAEQFSIQKNTAAVGGDLGFFQEKELGDLSAQLFSLRKAEWTGPMTDNGKFLFVKCTDKKDSREKSFEESSQDIQETLRALAWIEYRGQCIAAFKNVKVKSFPEKVYVLNLN
jgi:parvulin-like peptidyl-prolyl isomerase